MRKLLLLLAAFAMLAVTGAVSAATTTTVTITKAGYVPSAPKISQGDSVQFVNSDTAAHQIVFKTMTGITCAPNPLVLQPGQSGTCSFQNAGATTFSDPNAKGNTFRGTVTINGAADSLTLVTSLHSVVYGGHVTLSGVLSSHKVGENVDVIALGCGTSGPVKVATVLTTTNGAFTASVRCAFSPLMAEASPPLRTARLGLDDVRRQVHQLPALHRLPLDLRALGAPPQQPDRRASHGRHDRLVQVRDPHRSPRPRGRRSGAGR